MFRSTVIVARLAAALVGVALVVRLLDEWWSYLPAGVIADLGDDVGLSYAQAGWLLSLLTIGGLLGGPLAALADHLPRQPMACAGAALIAAGLAVYAFGAPFPALAAASFALGSASDLLVTTLEVSLADTAGERLDKLLGLQHTLSWLGDLAAPGLIAVCSATTIGWRGAFAITAGVMALYAVVISLVSFPAPSPAAADDGCDATGADRDRAGPSVSELLRNRHVALLAAVEFILVPVEEPLLGFAIARLERRGYGATAQVIAVAFVVGGIAGSAIVARRGITRWVRRAGAPLMVGGAVVVTASPWLGGQIIGIAALANGTAMVWATVHHRLLTVVPGRGATVSAITGALATPAALVAVAAGAIADASSLTWSLALIAAVSAPLLVLMPVISRHDVRSDASGTG